MTLIPGSRQLIHVEGTQFRGAVSEELIQRIAKLANFISLYQHSEKQFFLNGYYNALTVPYLGIDGLTVMEFNAEIINAWAFNLEAGAGGTTELDIKRATTPGGAFTSIFSTTPKFTNAAGDNAWIGVGETLAGATAPVMSPLNSDGYLEVNAGDALRFDLISAQTGATSAGPRSCGILLHYRPR